MYFYMRNMQSIRSFNTQQKFSKKKVMKLKRRKLKMNEENLAHYRITVQSIANVIKINLIDTFDQTHV